MNQVQEFDQFMHHLQNEIEANPAMKSRIIIREIEKTGCPYLKEKIQTATFV